MREELLKELESRYDAIRAENERGEAARRDRIRREFPEIEALAEEREGIVFGTIRKILDGKSDAADLTRQMASLNSRIEEALVRSGLPSDYLSPIYRCPVCRDTGYTGDPVKEPCECMKRAYQQLVREKTGLDKKEAETFEAYDESLIPDEPVKGIGITQRQLSRIAREQCEKWADAYPDVQQRDILLTGGSGLGKTFLMHAMAARLIERGQYVLIASAYTFLQIARKSYFDGTNGIQELLDVPVLMLDDLGSEPLMQNITVEQLFYLINERQSKNLSTVISTNLTLQELRERYTERIVSRLNSPKNCLILTLAGRDLRKLER